MKLEQPKGGIVALDPGGLVFMSIFSNDGYSEVASMIGARHPTPNPNLDPLETTNKRNQWKFPKRPSLPPPPNPNPSSTKHHHRVREVKKKCSTNRLSGPLMVDAHRIRTIQSDVDRSIGKREGQTGYLSSTARRNRRKTIRKLWARIKRIVDDIHRKLISKLTQKYALILIPKFNVSAMVRRGSHRVIGKKSVSNLLRWAHYRFRARLIQAARFTACSVAVVNEAYTSKTCTGCGNLNQRLGGSRIFRCKRCNIEVPRDANGARNILIRYLLRFVKDWKPYSKFDNTSTVHTGAR
jgi:hypothetical protein